MNPQFSLGSSSQQSSLGPLSPALSDVMSTPEERSTPPSQHKLAVIEQLKDANSDLQEKLETLKCKLVSVFYNNHPSCILFFALYFNSLHLVYHPFSETDLD